MTIKRIIRTATIDEKNQITQVKEDTWSLEIHPVYDFINWGKRLYKNIKSFLNDPLGPCFKPGMLYA